MRPRLIPVLLLDRDRRLVKTVRFGERTYIGDPFNVVRLFNEKEVDEICILDIDASLDGRLPDVGFLSELAAECFMPLSYGGGVAPGAPLAGLARAGVEKFIVGSRAGDPAFIRGLAADYGSQAVVGCVDYRDGPDGSALIRSASTDTGRTARELSLELVDAGAGEIIAQSIEHDGMRSGMDLGTLTELSAALPVPLVALGGAREAKDLEAALEAGAHAAASGSAFSFIGKLRAVLINYPTAFVRDGALPANDGGAA